MSDTAAPFPIENPPDEAHWRETWRSVTDLLGSMRFAISLLSLICIASVIGTVLKQNEPAVNYVNQFGPFWAELFTTLSLPRVYSAWWFLLILAFLVISTSLCIARNTPKILQDLKTFKEGIRPASLKAFAHKAEWRLEATPEAAAQTLMQTLVQKGWKIKAQSRTGLEADTGIMIAAKKGSRTNKFGYLAAHCSIVLICLGGLLDGDMLIRAQTWFGGKALYQGGGLISDVPQKHWLSIQNPSYRGNIMVAEGQTAATAVVTQSGGILLQPLPFAIELKKFIVEFYSTGMPKLFASEVIIHDNVTGAKTPARIEVNHPLVYKGVTVYQSSFEDGGSKLTLRSRPIHEATKSFEVKGVVGGSTQLSNSAEKLTLEFSGLRVFNIENFGASTDAGVGVNTSTKKSLSEQLNNRLGGGHKAPEGKVLHNVGPSVSYKLRDEAGQAREFNNYMQPVDMRDGSLPVFLLGVRDTPAEAFRYLRIPADAKGSMDGFFALRAGLQDANIRTQAAKAYAAKSANAATPALAEQLTLTAERALSLFAGVGTAPTKIAGDQSTQTESGLQAISTFLETNVPAEQREKTGEVLLRVLNGALYEMYGLLHPAEVAALTPESEQVLRGFINQALLGMSDVAFYPAPLAFMLDGFEQVQASVFQVAKAPGQSVVYLGSVLLMLGVFAMLYVRERRLWVWVRRAAAPNGTVANAEAAGSHVQIAYSSNRKTLDTDTEFNQLKADLL